jgi:hypothetical protein
LQHLDRPGADELLMAEVGPGVHHDEPRTARSTPRCRPVSSIG